MGPYIITEVIPGGAYRLQDRKTGKDESNPWNAEQLRRFYAQKEYSEKKLSSYDPLNPEHEATGRVLWVISTICMSIFSFHSGALTHESYEIKQNKLLRFGIRDYLRHITRLFAT
jgi:hypothetical protein